VLAALLVKGAVDIELDEETGCPVDLTLFGPARVAPLPADVTLVLFEDDTANGSFTLNATYPTGVEPIRLIAADFDQDRVTDLAVIHTGDRTLRVLLGRNTSE